jgi:uncharacterized membrane protein YagU involved in acid resistance
MKYSQIEKSWQRYTLLYLKKYNICSSIMIPAKQIVHNKYCIRWTELWSERIGCLLDFIGNTLMLDLSVSPKKGPKQTSYGA